MPSRYTIACICRLRYRGGFELRAGPGALPRGSAGLAKGLIRPVSAGADKLQLARDRTGVCRSAFRWNIERGEQKIESQKPCLWRTGIFRQAGTILWRRLQSTMEHFLDLCPSFSRQ
jgi:hypothetical protein